MQILSVSSWNVSALAKVSTVCGGTAEVTRTISHISFVKFLSVCLVVSDLYVLALQADLCSVVHDPDCTDLGKQLKPPIQVCLVLVQPLRFLSSSHYRDETARGNEGACCGTISAGVWLVSTILKSASSYTMQQHYKSVQKCLTFSFFLPLSNNLQRHS